MQFGFIQPAKFAKSYPEIVVSVDKARIERDGAAVRGLGVGELS